MPDSFAHKFNAQNALRIAGYKPRNYPAFILGCNGPDPLFNYRIYNPFSKSSIRQLGSKMHVEKTGLFLQNLFLHAHTDIQKDYCLGFLCHYSLDSTMHPYVNYITTAYSSHFNKEHGHGYFESALDSLISYKQLGVWAANPREYCPDIEKRYLDQIVTLFKQATETTYTEEKYDRNEYLQAFKDFKAVKSWLYSPKKRKFFIAAIAENLLGFKPGFIMCHMQPCQSEIKNIPVWRNSPVGFFCTSTIEDLFGRADHLSADYLNVGLSYFNGTYSLRELLEDIGNKSYETGLSIDG